MDSRLSLLDALTMFDKLVARIAKGCRVPTQKEKEALDRALLAHNRAAEAAKLTKDQAVPQFVKDLE